MLFPDRTRMLLAGAAGFVFIIATGESQAQETITVTATVPDACAINAGGTLNFDEYTPGQTNDKTSTVSFDVVCSAPANADISLDAGLNFDGTERRMSDGPGNFLIYRLFDSGYSTPWGDDGVSIAHPSQNFTLAQGTNLVTIGGMLPALQSPLGATYSDTVTISIDFN